MNRFGCSKVQVHNTTCIKYKKKLVILSSALTFSITLTFSILGKFSRRQWDDIFSLFSQKIGFNISCKLSLWDNLHKTANPIFLEKLEKYFKISSAEFFTQHAVFINVLLLQHQIRLEALQMCSTTWFNGEIRKLHIWMHLLSRAFISHYMVTFSSWQPVNPLSANHNYCHLLCHLLVILKVIFANSVDPDQTAPLGAVWSGSTLFAYMQNVSLKSLQEDAADDISRLHFQMQIFLVL